MASRSPDLSYLFGLPARDARAYLESLGVLPTERWDDLLMEARACALTVAGMTSLDLLNEVRGALVSAMNDGKTAREFKAGLLPLLQARGWTGKREVIDKKTGEVRQAGPGLSTRLNLIFFQNMQTAYMAGRYRAMLANADDRPWWMYVAVRDSRTRASHRALDRRVFRYDDPFWQKFYPPNGFNCRCTVRALDDDDLGRLGLEPEDSEGKILEEERVINPRAPEEKQKTVRVSGYQPEKNGPVFWTAPGFSWNQGYATWSLDHALAQKLDSLKSPKLYAEAVQAINNLKARQTCFGTWISRVLQEQKAKGDATVLGLVQPEVVEAAIRHGKEPARLAIITDSRVMHADSESHKADGAVLSEEQYRNLAKDFANPEAIYWQRQMNCALYIFPDEEPDMCVVMVLNLPSKEKGAMKSYGPFDGFVTAYRKSRKRLKLTEAERIK